MLVKLKNKKSGCIQRQNYLVGCGLGSKSQAVESCLLSRVSLRDGGSYRFKIVSKTVSSFGNMIFLKEFVKSLNIFFPTVTAPDTALGIEILSETCCASWPTKGKTNTRYQFH